MKAVKKITMKEVGYSKKTLKTLIGAYTELYEKTNSEVPILRVMGRVRSKKSEVSTINGEAYTRFTGEFQATNLANGEIYRSDNVILPAVAEIPINDMTQDIEKEGPATFGIDITFKPTYSEEFPYQFGVNIHGQVPPLDFLSVIEESMPPLPMLPKMDNVLELEAPDNKKSKTKKGR